MTKRADTTVIEVADPHCGGVTDPTGRYRYDKDGRGRIEVPNHVAQGILRSGHPEVRRYRPVFAMSLADVLERARQLQQKKEETPSEMGETPDADG